MNRFTLSLLACTLAMCGAHATVLTPQQALARAEASQQLSAVRRAMPAARTSTMRLTRTISRSGAPTVYVFGSDNAFVVTSADNIGAPILGYGDSAADKIAPELEYWLDTYSREIAWARAHGVNTIYRTATATDTLAAIAPLVKTKWNQEEPYSNDCPVLDNQHCVTGCVATALAQVMKYHEYPEVASGQVDYWLNRNKSDSLHVTLDLDTVRFDWRNMTDTYDSKSTATENAAVAQLMFACGAACGMDYGIGESGTAAIKAAEAMVKNFKYDRGIHFYYRDYYNLADWQNIVYNQLKDYGPVQYSGQSDSGGHSFVCDGYSQDGYFHINWGWGGMSDGYFLLTSLTPGEQGVGGSGSGEGFNFDQSIIGCVRPFVADSKYYPDIMWSSDFTTSTTSASLGETVKFSGMYYNFGIAEVSGNMGVKLTPATGSATYVKGMGIDLKSYYGYSYFDVTLPASLADGTYTVTPAVYANDQWYDVPVKISNQQNVTMTVSNGTCTFTAGTTAYASATDVTLVSPIYIGCQFELTATLTNSTNAEYLNSIEAALTDTSYNVIATGEAYSVDIPANSSTPLDYKSTFKAVEGDTLSAGTYYLMLIDNSYHILSTPVQVTVNAATGHKLSCTAPAYVESSDKDLTMTATVTNETGYFAGEVRLYIFRSTGGGDIASYGSQALYLQAGDSKSLTFSGTFDVGIDGDTYIAQVFADGSAISDATYFTYKVETTGITDVNTSSNDSTRYFNLQGIAVDNPTNGVYIAVTTHPDGSITRNKILLNK